MSWEWIAAPVVGLAGIVGTYLAGRRQQDTALRVVGRQTSVQVAIAREERQQRRIESAYLELLTAMTSLHYWVFMVYPPLTNTVEQYTMPPLPGLPDSARKEGVWTAYWSPRVEELMIEWEGSIWKLEHAGVSIGMARAAAAKGQNSGIDEVALVMELPALKQSVRDADKRVRNQIRLELLGKDEGQAVNTPEVADSARGADEGK